MYYVKAAPAFLFNVREPLELGRRTIQEALTFHTLTMMFGDQILGSDFSKSEL